MGVPSMMVGRAGLLLLLGAVLLVAGVFGAWGVDAALIAGGGMLFGAGLLGDFDPEQAEQVRQPERDPW